MCDTMVALPAATRSGATIFAKNSDRERNEGQPVEWHTRASHPPGAMLRATWIAIPQAAETHAVLLSRPFWCWGAEIGANEHGLVVGNEAVRATIPPSREKALIGMDLVRLALERAATAAEGVAVLTGLLERHGQGGDCGHLVESFYDNAFMLADAREAFVVETIGRMWAVERVAGFRAISNALSIPRGGIWREGGGLVAQAVAAGLCTGAADLDMGAALRDPAREAVSHGMLRCGRATGLLARDAPGLEVRHLKAILRDHGAAAEGDAGWHPARTVGRTICMHAGAGERRGQTTGSMVSELRADGTALHWITATAAPCLSVFRPVLPGLLPDHGPAPRDEAGASLWWRHERLHRAAECGDFAAALAAFAPARDALEARFRGRIEEVAGAGRAAQAEAVAACWAEAAMLEDQAFAALLPMPDADAAHAESWRAMDARAGLVTPA